MVITSYAKTDTTGIEKKVDKLHQKILTIDSHTDTPFELMQNGFNIAIRHDPGRNNTKIDFPRMKEGGLDAAFFAVFVSQGKRTPEGNEKVMKRAQILFDTIHHVVNRNMELAGLALSPRDAYRLKREDRIAVFIGIENGYAIGDDIEMIRTYFKEGARYITLCHTRNNDICDSSTDSTEWNGLSEFGKNVVLFMNKTGMMVDVSHISDKSFYDVLAISKAPVIASHSCSRAVCNNPRNLDDDMLRALAKNGGIIQMCILSAYVKAPDSGIATVKDVVDHIDHIVKVAGIDHAGIGTDFDGGGGVKGCDDVSQMKNITRELVLRGYSDRDIQKIWGGNLMRVMREVTHLSKKINKACGCS